MLKMGDFDKRKILVFFLALITTVAVGVVFHKAYNWPVKGYAVHCGSPAGPTLQSNFTEVEVRDGYINTNNGPYFPGPYEMCNIQIFYTPRN